METGNRRGYSERYSPDDEERSIESAERSPEGVGMAKGAGGGGGGRGGG